jgi:hypothetical protein
VNPETDMDLGARSHMQALRAKARAIELEIAAVLETSRWIGARCVNVYLALNEPSERWVATVMGENSTEFIRYLTDELRAINPRRALTIQLLFDE